MDKREIYELVKNIDRWKHKVEVTFTEPVRIYSPKKKTRHTFAKLIVTENLLYNGQESFCFWYTPRKNSRYRYKLDEIVVEKIKNVRIIDTQKSSEFKTLESFVKRFDTRYITKKEIEGLYNGKSSQTGRAYDKRDFKQMGPRGKALFDGFDEQFTGVNKLAAELNGRYSQSPYGDYKVLSSTYITNQHPGRDIRISHSSNQYIVHYSSEYSGCGNGSYGIVAKKGVWLHLEDD